MPWSSIVSLWAKMNDKFMRAVKHRSIWVIWCLVVCRRNAVSIRHPKPCKYHKQAIRDRFAGISVVIFRFHTNTFDLFGYVEPISRHTFEYKLRRAMLKIYSLRLCNSTSRFCWCFQAKQRNSISFMHRFSTSFTQNINEKFLRRAQGKEHPLPYLSDFRFAFFEFRLDVVQTSWQAELYVCVVDIRLVYCKEVELSQINERNKSSWYRVCI